MLHVQTLKNCMNPKAFNLFESAVTLPAERASARYHGARNFSRFIEKMGAAQSNEPIEEPETKPVAEPEAVKPVNAEGRKRLQISQGVVPPKDQSKFDAMMEQTHFSEAQVKTIMKHFGSSNYQYGLNKEKFGEIMEQLGLFSQAHKHGFSQNELNDVFFSMFDENHDGEVSFMEFCAGVAVVLKGDVKEKAKMLFRMYDTNGDNKITRLEMSGIIKSFLTSTRKFQKAQARNMAKFIGEEALQAQYELVAEETVSDDEVRKIVDSAFDKADSDGNNEIHLDEFVEWVSHSKAMHQQMLKLGFKFSSPAAH